MTYSSNQPRQTEPLLSFVRFVALAYLLTWPFTITFVYLWNNVFNHEMPPWIYLLTIGAYGPTFAALIMAHRRGGGAGVRRMLSGFVRWRVNPLCWIVALGFSYAAAALTIGLGSTGFQAWNAFSLPAFISVASATALFAIWFGPLPEELGWRGFGVPVLIGKYGVLVTSLFVSLAWTFWHTPMFWFPGAAIPSVFDVNAQSIFFYWLGTFAESIVLTLLMVWSRGSVLLAILFHLCNNIAEDTLFGGLGIEPSDEVMRQFHFVHLVIVGAGAALLFALDKLLRRKPASLVV